VNQGEKRQYDAFIWRGRVDGGKKKKERTRCWVGFSRGEWKGGGKDRGKETRRTRKKGQGKTRFTVNRTGGKEKKG